MIRVEVTWFDLLAMWVGRAVLIAGGLVLTVMLLYLLCDVIYRRMGLIAEFIDFAVDRRRRNRKSQHHHECEKPTKRDQEPHHRC